jgi:hypothetical protein
VGFGRLDDGDVVAVGVAQHEQQRRTRCLHRFGIEVDATDITEPPVFGEHVGSLHADAAPTRCCANRFIQRQASVRWGRRDLDPPVLAVRPDAGVGPQLESELVCRTRWLRPGSQP